MKLEALIMYLRDHTRTGWAFLLAVVLAGCLLCAPASAGPTDPTEGITPTNLTTGIFQIASVGQTIDVPITLDEAPLGFMAMQFTIKVDNASVADITDIEFPSWTTIGAWVDTGIPDPENPGTNFTNWQELQTATKTQLAPNRWMVTSRDGASQVNETSTNVVIATAKVQGKAVGWSWLNLSVLAADTDAGAINMGYWYPFPLTPPGKLYVGMEIPPEIEAPTSAFSANVTTGDAPLAVGFTDESTGTDITAWSWTFGDGSTSSEQHPNHIYTAAGTYTVELTVTNAGGSDDELKTDYITVTGAPVAPVADFSATPTSGVAPLDVAFTDSSTNGPTTWAWDFDNDGTVDSTEQNPSYTYAAAGTYTVKLTATNAAGSDDEVKTDYITVTEPSVVTPTPTVTVTPTPTTETTGPYPAPHTPSARIEAEDFDMGGQGVAYSDLEPANLGNSNHRPGEGVDIETVGGVTNVGWIRAGEYLKYSVDTTAAGEFTLTLRAANPEATAKAVKVYLDGVPAGQVTVGGTGSWTSFKDFTGTTALTIPAGRHVVTLAFEGINRINLDWLSLTAGPVTTPTPDVTLLKTTPYGPGNNIPGRVQAENFDKSGVDAAYSDTTSINEGGAYRPSEPVDIEWTAGIQSHNIGWIRTGEYLVYTVQVTKDGQYTATFNAANPDTTNKAVDVFLDGTKVGTAQIGATGSFGTFKKFDFAMTLPVGKHQIKLAFPSQRLNIDYIEFSTQGAVVTTPTTTPPVTGSANFVAVPTTARHGSAFKFTLTPTAGKTIKSAWWSFDAPAHLNTWNSRNVNPTFFYFVPGTFSPLVKITYTDGSTEEVHRVNYIKST